MTYKILAAAGVMALLAASAPASAAILIFDTSDSPFDAGIDNQGWWSTTVANSDTNHNYVTGTVSDDPRRSFFTFDLGGALAGQTVVSATLRLRRFGSSAGNEATETLEFFDVSTAAATLNENNGTSAAIFADLGTGTSYGSFDVPGSGLSDDVLNFALNAAALADIGSAAGFFSIGGSLTSDNGNDFLFGFSNNTDPQQLVVETLSVPEPAAMALFGLGLAGLGFARRRRAAA